MTNTTALTDTDTDRDARRTGDMYAAGMACTECSVLIANGDDSALGSDPDRLATAEATIAAIARDNGGPVIVTPLPDYIDRPGVFRCCICGDDSCGPAVLAGTVTD